MKFLKAAFGTKRKKREINIELNIKTAIYTQVSDTGKKYNKNFYLIKTEIINIK